MSTEQLEAAEASLIGAAITDEKVFHEAALRYSQFYNPRWQLAWKVIGELTNKGVTIDPIAVSEASGGKVTIPDLSKAITVTGPLNVLRWATIVRDQFIQRGVATISAEFNEWSKQGLSGPEMLSRVQRRLEDLENASERKLPTLADVARSESDYIANTPPDELRGLPTGMGIERVTPGGIPRGKVTTVFGESGNFKTTVKNNIVLGMASAGYKVLDVSLEDADELTAHRFLASCTGLNYGKIAAHALSEADRRKLKALPEKALAAAENVILAGEIIPNIDEIIRVARYYKQTTGLHAVVIDYVQLLEGRNPRQTQKELLDEIMRKSQLAAKRDNMAYIIVSQVKQDVDTRTNHEPRITDMIGSSAMRTASKLSIGVYRPGLYHQTPQKGSPYERLLHNHPRGTEIYPNLLELHFLKNVLGEPRKKISCLVHPSTGHIEPFDLRPYQ